ncbi:MAG: MATE family efflux transporter [Lachnospiraceae bacterium]|nr:MATE family efflux transporter [Lachnospiraceae bacterium]
MASTRDMTEGRTFPIIFAFFIPVLGSTLCQQLYNIVDTIVVGKGVGDMALAAVGATGAITFFMYGFIFGLGSGMGVLMSQRFGAGDYNGLRKSITMGILTNGITGITIALLGMIFMRSILEALNTSELLMHDAMLYIIIILCGTPISLFYNCYAAILSSLGDSRTPLMAVLLSSGVNIVLDIVLVIVVGMGVEGAAIGTLLAQICAGVFCYIKVKSIEVAGISREDWIIDTGVIKQMFSIGVPIAFMNSITAIGVLVLQFFVNAFGVQYTAAYSAGGRIVEFAMQPCAAAGMSLSTFAGQNLGAKKIDRIMRGLGDGVILASALAVISGILLFFFPEQIVSRMLTDKEIIALAVPYLKICGSMMWAISFLFLVRDTLQGMGKTFVPMLSGILELIARVVVVFLFSESLGFKAIALSETAAWVGAFILNGVFLVIELKRLKRSF